MFKPYDLRGFRGYEFRDRYNEQCSIQKSSSAEVDSLWLGISDVRPLILASHAARNGVQTEGTCGWVPYPLPADVMVHSRMHLSQEQVRELLPLLQHFADTGELPELPTREGSV